MPEKLRLDDRRWHEPLLVDFARPGLNAHAGFGNGPHHCPGSNLARTEVRIFLEEWLKRIPDFEIPASATGGAGAPSPDRSCRVGDTRPTERHGSGQSR